MDRSLRLAKAVPTRQGMAIAFSDAEAHALRLNAYHEHELEKTQAELSKARVASITAAERDIEAIKQIEEVRLDTEAHTLPTASTLPPIRLYPSDGSVASSLTSARNEPAASADDREENAPFRISHTGLRQMRFLTRSLPTLYSLAVDDSSTTDGLEHPPGNTVKSARHRARSDVVDLPSLTATTSALTTRPMSSVFETTNSRLKVAPSYASPASSRRSPLSIQRSPPTPSKLVTAKHTDPPSRSPSPRRTRLPPLAKASSPSLPTSREGSPKLQVAMTSGVTNQRQATKNGSTTVTSSQSVCRVRIVSVIGPAKSDDRAVADLSFELPEEDSIVDEKPPDTNPFLVRKDWTKYSEPIREPITMDEAMKSSYVRLPPQIANSKNDVHDRLADTDAIKAIFA